MGVDYGIRRLALGMVVRGPDSDDVCWTDELVLPAPKKGEAKPHGEELLVMTQYVRDEWLPVLAKLPERRALAIEMPITGGSRNALTAAQMAMVAGMLTAVLSEVPMVKVSYPAPSSWKKKVVGHGGSDKAAVREFITNEWPYLEMPSHDVADAVAIAMWAWMDMEGR